MRTVAADRLADAVEALTKNQSGPQPDCGMACMFRRSRKALSASLARRRGCPAQGHGMTGADASSLSTQLASLRQHVAGAARAREGSPHGHRPCRAADGWSSDGRRKRCNIDACSSASLRMRRPCRCLGVDWARRPRAAGFAMAIAHRLRSPSTSISTAPQKQRPLSAIIRPPFDIARQDEGFGAPRQGRRIHEKTNCEALRLDACVSVSVSVLEASNRINVLAPDWMTSPLAVRAL